MPVRVSFPYGRAGESCQNITLQAGTKTRVLKINVMTPLFYSSVAIMNSNLISVLWVAWRGYTRLGLMALLPLYSSPLSLRDSFSRARNLSGCFPSLTELL